jgi:hypothetical protein
MISAAPSVDQTPLSRSAAQSAAVAATMAISTEAMSSTGWYVIAAGIRSAAIPR